MHARRSFPRLASLIGEQETAVAAILMCLPLVCLLLWHVRNGRWPMDDAADYAHTAYQIYNHFYDRGFFSGVAAMLDLRGWRPIIYPVFTLPFLAVFRRNIPE